MKKVILLSISLLIIVSGFFIVFWPKNKVVDVMVYYQDNGLNDRNLSEFVKSNKGKHVYYFCVDNNNDCAFVNNNILKEFSDKLLMTKLDFINYVNLSKTSPTAAAKYKAQWGFTHYPAFVILDDTATPYKLIDSIGWEKDNPFNAQDIKDFLIKNKVWPTQ